MTRLDRTALDAALQRLYGHASAPGRLMERLAGADAIPDAFDPALEALPLLHARSGDALWAGTGLEASLERSLARADLAPAPAPAPVAPVVPRPEGHVSRNAPVEAAGRARIAALLDETAAVERAPAEAGTHTAATGQRAARGQGAAPGHAARRLAGTPTADASRAQPAEPPAQPARARRTGLSARPDGAAAAAPSAGPAVATAPAAPGHAAPARVSVASDRTPAPLHGDPGSSRSHLIAGPMSDGARVHASQVYPGQVSADAARARWRRAAERAGATSALTRPVTAGMHAGAPDVAEHTRHVLQAVAGTARGNADVDGLAAAAPAGHAASSVPGPDAAVESGADAGNAGAPGVTAQRLASALSRLSHARQGSQRTGVAGPAAPRARATWPASAPAAPAEWPTNTPAAPIAGPPGHAGPERFAGSEPFAASPALREPAALEGLSGLRRMAALAGVDPTLGASPGSDTAPAWSPAASVPGQAGARLPLPAMPPPASQARARDAGDAVDDRRLADRIADILRREAERHGIDVERDEP